MAIKQQKVSMPMTSAGIIGFSSDVKLSGMEFDPKSVIIMTAIIVLAVKLLGHFLY